MVDSASAVMLGVEHADVLARVARARATTLQSMAQQAADNDELELRREYLRDAAYVLNAVGALEEAARRRAYGITGKTVIGDLVIDPVPQVITIRGQQIEHLTRKEWALLSALALEPNRVFSVEELLRGVWGFKSAGCTRTIDSHAYRVRRKLCVFGDRYVVNKWGRGYQLTDTPVAA